MKNKMMILIISILAGLVVLLFISNQINYELFSDYNAVNAKTKLGYIPYKKQRDNKNSKCNCNENEESEIEVAEDEGAETDTDENTTESFVPINYSQTNETNQLITFSNISQMNSSTPSTIYQYQKNGSQTPNVTGVSNKLNVTLPPEKTILPTNSVSTSKPVITRTKSSIQTSKPPVSTYKYNVNSPSPAPAFASSLEKDDTDYKKCPDVLIRMGNDLMLYNQKLPQKPGENPIYFKTLDDYIYYVKMQREEKGQHCPVLFLQKEVNSQGEDVFRFRPDPLQLQGGLSTSPASDPRMSQVIADYFKNTNITAKPTTQPTAEPITEGMKNIKNVDDLQNEPSAFNQSNNKLSYKYTPGPPRNTVAYTDANMSNPDYNQGYFGFDPQNQYTGKYTVIDSIHDMTGQSYTSLNAMDDNWEGNEYTRQMDEYHKLKLNQD